MKPSVGLAVVSSGDLHLRSPPKFIHGVDRIQFTAAVGLKSLISAGWQPGVTLCSFHMPPPSAPPGMAVCFIFFQDSRGVSQMYHLLWKSGPLRIGSLLTILVNCPVTWPREWSHHIHRFCSHSRRECYQSSAHHNLVTDGSALIMVPYSSR